MKTKTTTQLLAEAIEMIEPESLREFVKKAFDQWLKEQAAILKIKI